MSGTTSHWSADPPGEVDGFLECFASFTWNERLRNPVAPNLLMLHNVQWQSAWLHREFDQPPTSSIERHPGQPRKIQMLRSLGHLDFKPENIGTIEMIGKSKHLQMLCCHPSPSCKGDHTIALSGLRTNWCGHLWQQFQFSILVKQLDGFWWLLLCKPCHYSSYQHYANHKSINHALTWHMGVKGFITCLLHLREHHSSQW